jgi:hypothetical protein
MAPFSQSALRKPRSALLIGPALLPVILLAAAALLALLILALPFELFLANLVLAAERMFLLAHVAVLGAVVAALPILGHGIFSCDGPEQGTREERTSGFAVPVVSDKSLKRRRSEGRGRRVETAPLRTAATDPRSGAIHS